MLRRCQTAICASKNYTKINGCRARAQPVRLDRLIVTGYWDLFWYLKIYIYMLYLVYSVRASSMIFFEQRLRLDCKFLWITRWIRCDGIVVIWFCWDVECLRWEAPACDCGYLSERANGKYNGSVDAYVTPDARLFDDLCVLCVITAQWSL